MWTRGRVTLARSGCGHISLVQEQSRQHVRKDCSTKGSHIAMLCRPRKTAFQKHNHYKWLHEQKRLWPSMETEVIDIATKVRLQATNLPPSGWGRHLTPTLKAPGQQAEETCGARAIKLG